jgi:hypothetical protein
MEEIQNESLIVCSQSSSMFSPPFSIPTEFSRIDTSKVEEENSDRPLSCGEPFDDVNLPDLNCFVKYLISPQLF